MAEPLDYLARACQVCEHGSSVAAMTQILFSSGRLSAFNGLVQFQAPSGLEDEEAFAVSEKRLAVVLRSCGENAKLSSTKEFLRLKQGPLTVRVRKLLTNLPDFEVITLPKSAASQKAEAIHAAIRRVRPFMSSDASRLWSISVLIRDGYAWATNNMSIVRTPLPEVSEEMRIPAPMVDLICELPSLGYYNIDAQNRLVFSYEKALMRCPQTTGEWPDMDKFFAKMPKTLPEVSPEMSEAARTVGKFADRFASITAKQIESRLDSIETDYEVDFAKGKGTYSAKLLSLILEHATHIDFSFYPEPIFFRGVDLEGSAVGMKK